MTRTVLSLILIVSLPLLGAAPVLAGGGFGGDVATGKIMGPAVSGTIVVDPTFGRATLGNTGLRLQKGTAFSGATFTNASSHAGTGWVLGCDGTHGANPPGDPSLNVVSLTTLRFVNLRMRSWVPAGVLAGLFSPLDITIDDFSNIPVVTQIDSPVCTAVDGGARFILSFNATIQFENLSN
jgi:hypothetical protein